MIGHGAGTTIVVTSPRAGAGTTTVACGTAVALAGQGKRVVLIGAGGAGLRPEQVLGVATSPGLGQLLNGDCALDHAMHPTDVPNLTVIPTGGPPETSLALQDLRLVLEQLEKAACVVIDAPPLLDSADSLLLADAADHVVLVGAAALSALLRAGIMARPERTSTAISSQATPSRRYAARSSSAIWSASAPAES